MLQQICLVSQGVPFGDSKLSRWTDEFIDQFRTFMIGLHVQIMVWNISNYGLKYQI
jgi:hypothetical protein